MGFLFGRKKKEEEQVDPNARSPQLGMKYKDLALLGQLMQSGADLSKPREAIYYLYFQDRAAAQAGATEAMAAGYDCEVQDPLPDFPGQWPLICKRPDAVLEPPHVVAADNLFQGIADRLGGDFDGWEADAT